MSNIFCLFHLVSELERNDLEQEQQFNQVQQLNQGFDEFEVQQALEPGEGTDDSTEDVIRMMPMRMDSSEGQSPASEKILSPDSELAEVEDELLNNSVEDDSSTERGKTYLLLLIF